MGHIYTFFIFSGSVGTQVRWREKWNRLFNWI